MLLGLVPLLLFLICPVWCSFFGQNCLERFREILESELLADFSSFSNCSVTEFVTTAKAYLMTASDENGFDLFVDFFTDERKNGCLRRHLIDLIVNLANEGSILELVDLLPMPDSWTFEESFALFKAYMSSGAELLDFVTNFSPQFKYMTEKDPEAVYNLLCPEDKLVIEWNYQIFAWQHATKNFFNDAVSKCYEQLSLPQLVMVCVSMPRFNKKTDLSSVFEFLAHVLHFATRMDEYGLLDCLKPICASIMTDFNLNSQEFQLLHCLLGYRMVDVIILGVSQKKFYRLLVQSPFFYPKEPINAGLEYRDIFFFSDIANDWVTLSDVYRPHSSSSSLRVVMQLIWMTHHAKVIEVVPDGIGFFYCIFSQFQRSYHDVMNNEDYFSENFRQQITSSQGNLQKFIDHNWTLLDGSLKFFCPVFSSKPGIALHFLEEAIKRNDLYEVKFFAHHLLWRHPEELKTVILKFKMLQPLDAINILDELLNAHAFRPDLIYTIAMQTKTFPLIRGIFSPCEDLETAVIPMHGLVLVEALFNFHDPEVRKIFSCFGIWSTIHIIDAMKKLIEDSSSDRPPKRQRLL